MTQHLHVPGEDLRLKKNLSLLSTPKMKPLPILLLASFIWMITAMQVIAQEEGGAIATLSRVEGYVEVFSEAKRKTRRGREGLMLFAGERINTGKDSKVTVEFRDGSTFRLFRKTDFLIEEGVEQNTRERSFKYQLSMKLGSLHGRMKRGMQRTRLRTPTAIVGVKGTTVRIT
ncbi:MAG: FecR domain-containing protein, partial [SAR324 cluster bacterium]|nr:FecR domain-containing protein [SAR324 cluster bacterium]